MRIGCIDAGNTRTKVAVYENGSLIKSAIISHQEATNWMEKELVTICVVSNVSKYPISIPTEFNGKWIDVNASLDLPFTINYHQPTLGADRIAAIAFAHTIFPNKACLIFDLGTCITSDYIDANGIYQGGSISPGVLMRLQAMHHFTGRLPNIVELTKVDVTGKDTVACMQSGVFYGIMHEIQGCINHYVVENPNLQIIITGGDSSLFVNHIKNSIFAAPDIVLEGLKEIALYHAKKGN
jgi:type III pantothenate kinase